ncbi:hypothetical protein BH09PSE1_BH09PSE1_25800 [soil metagenome]
MRPPRLRRIGPVRPGWLLAAVLALLLAGVCLTWIWSGIDTGVVQGHLGRTIAWHDKPVRYLLRLAKLILTELMLLGFAGFAVAMAFWKAEVERRFNRWIEASSAADGPASQPS